MITYNKIKIQSFPFLCCLFDTWIHFIYRTYPVVSTGSLSGFFFSSGNIPAGAFACSCWIRCFLLLLFGELFFPSSSGRRIFFIRSIHAHRVFDHLNISFRNKGKLNLLQTGVSSLRFPENTWRYQVLVWKAAPVLLSFFTCNGIFSGIFYHKSYNRCRMGSTKTATVFNHTW